MMFQRSIDSHVDIAKKKQAECETACWDFLKKIFEFSHSDILNFSLSDYFVKGSTKREPFGTHFHSFLCRVEVSRSRGNVGMSSERLDRCQVNTPLECTSEASVAEGVRSDSFLQTCFFDIPVNKPPYAL
jgi:hypothetical protein